jgi:energy-coupling factor transporter ATPase
LIELRHVSYFYGGRPAISGVSLTIADGETIAIIGPNASGKSTLARMMNGLILPQDGKCAVDGISTRENVYHARKAVGMVFQNPDDQIVSRRVVDDVAFGLLNLGFSQDESIARAHEALSSVGMSQCSSRATHSLSGGQKQLLAIAGVIAMRPRHVVFDEPTALLDGDGISAVRMSISRLKNCGTSIVLITHDMEEAMFADRIVVLQDGRIVMEGSPKQVFEDELALSRLGIEMPSSLKLSRALQARGLEMPDFEAVKAPCRSS